MMKYKQVAPTEANAPEASATVTLPNPWVAVIVVIVAFLVSSVIAQQLVSIYPALHHWSVRRTTDWLNTSVWPQFFYILLAYSMLLGTIIWFLQRLRIPLSAIGLNRPKWRHLGYALAALPLYYFGYYIIITVVSQLVPSLNINQKQQIGFSSVQGFLPLLVTFLSLAVIPPIVEEMVMRGFLFSSLRAKLALPVATIITSVLFAIGHLQFGSGAPLLWIAALDTFTLSLFLIYLRQKTDSLWASIALHALKNTTAFAFIFIFHQS